MHRRSYVGLTHSGRRAGPSEFESHDMGRAWDGTISAAMDRANPGDTLRLKVGTYRDSVSIEKTLTIKGSGWRTVLVPPDTRPLNKCNVVAEQQGGTPGAEEGICALGGIGPQGPDFNNRIKTSACQTFTSMVSTISVFLGSTPTDCECGTSSRTTILVTESLDSSR